MLIAADLCVLREPEETALCEVIMRKTGLTRQQVLLNWSHTHSGPMIGTSDLNRYPVPEDDLGYLPSARQPREHRSDDRAY